MEANKVSKCCKAKVQVLHQMELDKRTGKTWFLCTKCGKYCATVLKEE